MKINYNILLQVLNIFLFMFNTLNITNNNALSFIVILKFCIFYI